VSPATPTFNDERGPADATDDADGNAPDEASDQAPRRSRAGRTVVAVAVVLMVGMWGYVLYLAFGPGRQPPIDRLDDPAFAEAGEARCAEAVADVEALPGAGAAPDATERADVIDEADVVYATMLDGLEGDLGLAPAGDQRERAEAWLADWRTYLGDRADFADALRADPEARLLVSEKPGEGRQITGWIDEFANANRMPSCATPTDV
jgi:hypothetical protein